jgi:two-component sensor histidine kinase
MLPLFSLLYSKRWFPSLLLLIITQAAAQTLPPDTALAWAPASDRPRLLNEMAAQRFGTSPARALAYGRQAEAAARAIADPAAQAQAISNQGRAYFLLEQYEPALQAYMRALALNQQTGQLQGQSICFNNIGNVYLASAKYARALEFYQKSMRLEQQRGDSLGVGDSYVDVANAYSYLDTTKTFALAYYQRALALFQAAGNPAKETNVLNNLGDTYLAQRHYEQARAYFERSLALNRQLQKLDAQAQSLQNLGHVYQGLQQWATAIDYYRQSSAISHDFPGLERDNLKFLAEAYAHTGEYRAAYTAFRRYTELKDSVFSRETTDRINELDTRFQSQQQQEQIKVQQLTISRKNQLIGLTLAGTLLVLGLSAGLYRQYRQRHRANRQLLQANQEISAANHEIRQSVAEKEVLIQEIHHRVKNNLQLVSSLLSWQASTMPEPALVAALDESQARIQSMALVHEHLYRANNLAQVSIDEYLAELLASLHQAHGSTQQHIQLRTDLAPLVLEAKDAIPFGLLVNELVTNSYKHAFRGRAAGELRVVLTTLPGGFCLQVQDDGNGLPTAPATPAAKPHSLGMQLIKMLTKQLKAKLTVTSLQPSGVCFEIKRTI